MKQDRIVEGERPAVVQELRPGAHAPERGCPQQVARALPAVLDDAIARADVVQQEVAERADDLEAEITRDGELSAGNACSLRRGEHGRHVAEAATVGRWVRDGHVEEDTPARSHVRREALVVLYADVLRRGFCRPEKFGEGVYVPLIIFPAD